ncbi:AAA domain-containing protein [Enterococcus faecalis]|uniref:AAA domain-containing protein n=1 Tax=Enterococcus faecalis TaxID=1351 RepID=UPI00242D3761|nr:AAA domain-containing protein [Enterococcus faecalis]
MNKKENILDSWIILEQLTEGNINRKNKNLKDFTNLQDGDFQSLFFDFLSKKIESSKLKNNKERKCGLVIYFGIFNFQKVIEILRKEYRIAPLYNENTRTDKFTFAIYFDEKLNFLSEKLFFTVSGYIKYKKKLPENFEEAEERLSESLSSEFCEYEFNHMIYKILKRYQFCLEDCRYKFIENLDEIDEMHSFYIQDLKNAKELNTYNLEQYFNGYKGTKINVDTCPDSESFNPRFIEKVLQSKKFPLGRFVGKSENPLSLMQQIAVNLYINEEGNFLSSVNGPPGTGKTTLLSEIFAELTVKQAKDICSMKSKRITGGIDFIKTEKLGILPKKISDNNMVVTSSNNSAVKNIVDELPKLEKAEEFREKLLDSDYFTKISNFDYETDESNCSQEKWGMFSIEGGKGENVRKLLHKLKLMEEHLSKEYTSNPHVYKEFLMMYEDLDKIRRQAQTYHESLSKLIKLKKEWDEIKQFFSKERSEKLIELNRQKNINSSKLSSLEKEIGKKKKAAEKINVQIQELNNLLSIESRNMEVLRLQQPSFLRLKKIFNSKKCKEYIEKVVLKNELINSLEDKKQQLMKQNNLYESESKKIAKRIEIIQNDLEAQIKAFDKWKMFKQNSIKKIENKIFSLEKLQQCVHGDILDVSLPYEELQEHAPWFDHEFRIKQSQLFILALKVRKQFLYENVKNLNRARRIWKKQYKYISKKEGAQLILEAWQWINIAIPVISTTFASFGRMFKNLPINSIGNLFIDEAGQALPQASIGAIFRSKKILVVGDPSQIKPVLPVDENVMNLIRNFYNVDEKFVSTNASVQTIIDDASKYGYKKKNSWIGIPLWVHRRCMDPMFSISNSISYDNLMVKGFPINKSNGVALWYDVSGNADEKFVKEQAEFLKVKILERMKNNPKIKDHIYVISPFRNVVYHLIKTLRQIDFIKMDKNKVLNVGTVHTFQGKEADIVYFVLGADQNSTGAASWAFSDANMMNVAVTRAKKEFYIIGDKRLYQSLGSEVIIETINIMDTFH